MHAAVRKLGNSAGVIIPKTTFAELGLSAGDTVDMRLEDGCLILAPVWHAIRAGWAAASRATAKAGGDTLLWPEFGNAADDGLAW